MTVKFNKEILGIPTNIWIGQSLYVAVSVVTYYILSFGFNTYADSQMEIKLFAISYVLLMIVTNIIWRLAIKNNQSVVAVIAIVTGFLISLTVAQICILQVAHSSFDNYYKFRGCSELVTKSSDDATCKLSSGKIIKIVKFQDRWFLDGDLPNGFLSF